MDTNVNPSTEWFELVPIFLVCLIWKKSLSGERVLFHCDNQSICAAWEKLGSVGVSVLDMMRRTTMIAAENNFTLTVKHIARSNNVRADALSRCRMAFFQLVPDANSPLKTVPNVFLSLISVFEQQDAAARPRWSPSQQPYFLKYA